MRVLPMSGDRSTRCGTSGLGPDDADAAVADAAVADAAVADAVVAAAVVAAAVVAAADVGGADRSLFWVVVAEASDTARGMDAGSPGCTADAAGFRAGSGRAPTVGRSLDAIGIRCAPATDTEGAAHAGAPTGSGASDVGRPSFTSGDPAGPCDALGSTGTGGPGGGPEGGRCSTGATAWLRPRRKGTTDAGSTGSGAAVA
jgi:hypothetical protein